MPSYTCTEGAGHGMSDKEVKRRQGEGEFGNMINTSVGLHYIAGIICKP